ncbi:MAG: aspartate-semialdehyde dehydrogenase [Gammaproteobacteria bacterium]|nr:aspartate-semialdehyde dehydrogenase [Gammaproteobacteria bacterium]
MNQGVNVAVVGATGTVGETLLEILEARAFPVANLYPLEEMDAAGGRVQFGGKNLRVEDVAKFDFSQTQIAFFCASARVSREFSPKAAAANCVVIDRTPEFRLEEDVPLIVPEVNAAALANFRDNNIIAMPSCMVIQLAMVLKPLHDAAGVERVNVVTFQAVSGAGQSGVGELAKQTANLLNAQPIKPKLFPKQIAFNVIPQVGDFESNGYSEEEMKIVTETRKLFGDAIQAINPTTVRVPVFFGHSAAVHIETKTKLTAEAARALLKRAPGLMVCDDGHYPTPVSDAVGKDKVCVGRIREDLSHSKGLDLWITVDNVRKGAALNGIQIAEILLKEYLN